MFLLFRKNTLQKASAEGICCRRLWRVPFQLLRSSNRPFGFVLASSLSYIPCKHSSVFLFADGFSSKCAFRRGETLVCLFRLLYTILFFFQNTLLWGPDWPQTLFLTHMLKPAFGAVGLPFKNEQNAWEVYAICVKVSKLLRNGIHFVRLCFQNEQIAW